MAIVKRLCVHHVGTGADGLRFSPDSGPGDFNFVRLHCFLHVVFEGGIIRLLLKSKVAQSQYKRRFILIGTERETSKIRRELENAQTKR